MDSKELEDGMGRAVRKGLEESGILDMLEKRGKAIITMEKRIKGLERVSARLAELVRDAMEDETEFETAWDIKARAVLSELDAAPAEAQQEPATAGWYCAHCQRGVDPSEVTFHEAHEECGRIITDDKPPAQPSPAIPEGMVLLPREEINRLIEAAFEVNSIKHIAKRVHETLTASESEREGE